MEEIMMKRLTETRKALPALAAVALMWTVSAHAQPITLSAVQLDAVAAGGVETTAGFVCPVLSTDSVLNSPLGGALGIEGYYTIGGPDVTVPVHATNGDGAGSPGGPFSQPGDTNYTAIWSR
jgi:hypothetical protein